MSWAILGASSTYTAKYIEKQPGDDIDIVVPASWPRSYPVLYSKNRWTLLGTSKFQYGGWPVADRRSQLT